MSQFTYLCTSFCRKKVKDETWVQYDLLQIRVDVISTNSGAVGENCIRIIYSFHKDTYTNLACLIYGIISAQIRCGWCFLPILMLPSHVTYSCWVIIPITVHVCVKIKRSYIANAVGLLKHTYHLIPCLMPDSAPS